MNERYPSPFQSLVKDFEKLRDIFEVFGDHALSEKQWSKVYEEHGDFFEGIYKQFKEFFSDYEVNREGHHYNSDDKYPYGYLGRFQGVSTILYRLAYRNYHQYHRNTQMAWDHMYHDVKYNVDYWNDVKVPMNNKFLARS